MSQDTESLKLNRRFLVHFEKMSWRADFELFFEKSVLSRKMGQNERFFVCLFSSIGKMEANKIAE